MPVLFKKGDNLQRIRQLLPLSGLSIQERNNLLILLSKATDEELKPLAALFAEDSKWMRKIYDNYKSKQDALAQKGRSAWTAILKAEEALLQDMIKEN